MPRQETFIGRLEVIRERFRQAPEERSWSSSPRLFGRFMALSIRKASTDALGIQAAALAFTTLVALIPVLTAFSLVGARAFGRKAEIVELLSQLLPYSEEKIIATLQEFLDKTDQLSFVGVVLFLVTALSAFSTIEGTVNRIWNVGQQRSLKTRLVSFTLVIFWVPLLIGVSYWGVFQLQDQASMRLLADSLPANAMTHLMPFTATLIGLTMLYWLVPYTSVAFANALAGGLLSALLLEGLRRGFRLYVAKVPSVSLIYGSLGLAIFFIVSIYVAWWVVLLGSEAAYCLQNFRVLTRPRREAAPLEGSWLGLLALRAVAESVRDGQPITPHEKLAETLRLSTADLLASVRPLVAAGLLRETGGEAEGYLLACDPHELSVGHIFDIYEAGHWEALDALGPLEDLRARLTDSRGKLTQKTALADLLRPSGKPPAG